MTAEVKRPFFISETQVFAKAPDSTQWVKVNATTIEGAKRLAVKRARGVTYSARVAKQNAKGQFEIVAAMHNSSAITGRRAVWGAPTRPSLARD